MLEYKFLVLLNKEDDYYQSILENIKANNASIITRDEMDSGVDFRIGFSNLTEKESFMVAMYPDRYTPLSRAE